MNFAESMPLPSDVDIQAAVLNDQNDVLKYCTNKSRKQTSCPLWGVPVELSWMVLYPAVQLGSLNSLRNTVEAMQIRAAEKLKDEEDLSKRRLLASLPKGRSCC